MLLQVSEIKHKEKDCGKNAPEVAVKDICGVKHNTVTLIFAPELEPCVDCLFSLKDLLFLNFSGSYPRSECLKEAFFGRVTPARWESISP